MPLFVDAAALALIFGFLVVKRFRMDGTNWVIVIVGCLLIGLVVLYWSALVQLADRWLHSSGAWYVQARSSAPSASSLLGPPWLSASSLDRVLFAYRSPAVGLGRTLYRESLDSGIDDVYALAFFLHESRRDT